MSVAPYYNRVYRKLQRPMFPRRLYTNTVFGMQVAVPLARRPYLARLPLGASVIKLDYQGLEEVTLGDDTDHPALIIDNG
jgi:hypothetical protein